MLFSSEVSEDIGLMSSRWRNEEGTATKGLTIPGPVNAASIVIIPINAPKLQGKESQHTGRGARTGREACHLPNDFVLVRLPRPALNDPVKAVLLEFFFVDAATAYTIIDFSGPDFTHPNYKECLTQARKTRIFQGSCPGESYSWTVPWGP
ncbi:MAG: hypothetical protein ACRERU_07460 [Methylococcales bacterium]